MSVSFEDCTCECHTKGMAVRHLNPCCDRTYEKKAKNWDGETPTLLRVRFGP